MTDEPKNSEIDWGVNDDKPSPRSRAVPALPAAEPSKANEKENEEAPVLRFQPAFREEEYDHEDKEPFDRPDAQKVGIIGGKGVGKSYLFQSIVYRTTSGVHSGALTHFLEKDSTHLFTATGEEGTTQLSKTGKERPLNDVAFIERYRNWLRLPFTDKDHQRWYRLRLKFRTGWFGGNQKSIDIEFFDGSGEGFFELESFTAEEWAIWKKAYLPAKIMVFCFPLWAAFPSSDLTRGDREKREQILKGFAQVLLHYNKLRSSNGNPRVTSILALTMADDRRSGLRTLYERWISPFLDSPATYLKQLRRGSGVARYLNNARRISEALHEEFASVDDTRVAGLPQKLYFGAGTPWIIPLSAMDGERLTYLESLNDDARLEEAQNRAPIPIHVELPLLVALCERENALM